MLTVLTVSSALVLTLIILVPIRPSRQNVTSMPIAAGARRAPAGFLSLGCHSRTRLEQSRHTNAIGLTRSQSTLSDWPSLYVRKWLWGLLQ